MNKELQIKDLGLIEYKQAWEYQEGLFKTLIDNKLSATPIELPSHLLYCEHPHVYTLGKSGSEDNLLINYIQLQAKNAQFYKTNRGGDITYHGQGQIVGYPILDLEAFGLGIRQYIYNLEEVIIQTVLEYGIQSERLEGATGVWIEATKAGKARKICAMGVRASRQITMHGFALNVNTDLSYFDNINPCGFTDKSVTSLEKELGRKIDMQEVKDKLSRHFQILFEAK